MKPAYLRMAANLGRAYGQASRFTVKKVAEVKVLKDKYKGQKRMFGYE